MDKDMLKKRQYVFLSNWQGQDLKCACLLHKPLCDKHKECEEIELSLLPYEDIKECMKERSYKRVKGALRQR